MNPRMNRRTLMGLVLGGLGAGIAMPPARANGLIPNPFLFHSPVVQPFVDELPPIPALSGTMHTIEARTTQHRFHRDLGPSLSFGYGGMSYLGPTIEAFSGQSMSVLMKNRMDGHPFARDVDPSVHGALESDRLRPRTAFHLHGGVTPPAHDGHPMTTSDVGHERMHIFPNRQESATLWYHDHAMGITRLNVMGGLAGAVLMRDEFDTGGSDNFLGLPSGEYEWPLVLQEKMFKDSGAQSVRGTPLVPEGSWEGGAVGDVGVVNGKVWPQMEVARGLYRFRVLNAGSFSVWNLFFSNHMQFWILGSDGGLLDAPVAATSLRISPGERADILVDFSSLSAGETVELRNDEAPPFQAAVLGMTLMPRFCRFRASAARGFTGPVPTTLRGGARQSPALPPLGQAERTRHVSVNQILDTRMPPAMMTLNNLRFSDPDIEMPRQGSTEVWSIANATFDPHPIHLHLVHFRVLSRQSLDVVGLRTSRPVPPVGVKWAPDVSPFLRGDQFPPFAWEVGWKDTVLCPPQSVTRILVRFPTEAELGFDPDATFTGTSHGTGMGDGMGGGMATDHAASPATYQGYVWHCHVLDHEDHEMMLPYRVIA